MFKLLKVTGQSLEPEYNGGDFVLVSKIPFLLTSLRPGAVLAFRQPGYGTLLKRLERIEPDGSLYLLGTNPASVDSRQFGPVRRQDVLGKVILHVRRPAAAHR